MERRSPPGEPIEIYNLMTLPRCLFLLAALLTGAARSVAEPAPQAEARRPFLLGGIQLNETDHQRWSAALIQAGMNAVEVTVYAHQGPWNTAELWYAQQEPAVLAEIRAARQNGLQVVLILRVALDHNDPANRFLWHGLIYPESEARLALWFRRYGDFVVKWARVAAKEGVQVLGIASEMNALTATLPVADVPELAEYYLDDAKQTELRQLVGRHSHLFTDEVRVGMGAGDFASLDDFLRQRNRAERRWARRYTFADEGREIAVTDRVEGINRRRRRLQRHWQELIDEVRKVYPGLLTLAANFDNYHEVGFWSHLDLIGINAYFPLRASLESPLDEAALESAWRGVFDDIDAFRLAQGLRQSVVFTELGYTRRQGVTFAPWSSRGFVPIWEQRQEREGSVLLWAAQPIVPEERALAVRSLFAVWQEDPHLPLAGILYWKLSSRLDLGRYEPFMLYLGAEARDPLYDALTLFADEIRPLPDPLARARNKRYADRAEAIGRGDLEALAELGSRRSSVRPPRGMLPPLHLAVQAGQTAIVRHLVARGASLRRRDDSSFLPLHWTCYQSDPDSVEVLLPRGRGSWRDELGETPLAKCARLDNLPVMRELLRHRPELLEVGNELEQTPLRLAADQGSAEMVELLLAHGADAEVTDGDGVSPLHIAARRGEESIVGLLLAAAASDPRDREGNRPIHYAAYFGKAAAFQRLWRPGTELAANHAGQTLLHHAAHGGDVTILRLLLEEAIDMDRVDRDGRTALHFATLKTHRAAAALLLERGADRRIPDVDGNTAIHLSAASDDPLLMRLFLSRSMLDVRDRAGNTPLHHAAGWGRVENVRLLLAAGAAPGLKNKAGQTALEVAEASGRKRVVELLQRRT